MSPLKPKNQTHTEGRTRILRASNDLGVGQAANVNQWIQEGPWGRDYDSRLTTAKVPQQFKVTEKRFTTRVVGYMRKHGWHVQRNGWVGVGNQFIQGFPDLVCVRDVVLFVELKRADGKLRPPQEMWRDWIRDAGGNWELWRPQDWDDIKLRIN